MSSTVSNKHTKRHNRRSIRLRGYDYSQPGRYFITICIHDRWRRLFGNIVGGKMILNELGKIAHDEFLRLPDRFPTMELDDFQIMPNHVHAVIPIVATGGVVGFVTPATPAGAPLAGAPADTTGARVDTTASAGPTDTPADTTGAPLCGTNGAPARGAPAAGTGTGAGTGAGKPVTLGDIVGAYKSLVANECLKIYKSRNTHMGKLWQRNYYDHIVHDDISLYFIRRYIRRNPLQWAVDMEQHIDDEIDEFDMEEVQHKPHRIPS